MLRFHLDFETASKVDLPEVGSHLYCTHPSTIITHITARMHGEEPFVHWRFDRDVLGSGTAENQAAIDTLISWLLRAEDRSIVAHNAAFEYAVLKGVFQRQFRVDLSHLEPRHMDCTMARALVQGFPGSLDKAAAALDVGLSKDKPGAAALMRLCKPAKAYEQAHGGPVFWWELDPLAVYQQELDAAVERLGKRAKAPKDYDKELAKLRVKAAEKAATVTTKWVEDAELVSAYNIQDIVVEEAIDAKLPPLPPSEFETWCIDQALNLRGVTLNVPLIKLLDDSVQLALQRADAAIAEITNGDISKASQSGAITQWLTDRGLLCTGVSKDKIDGLRAQAFLLEDDAAAKVLDIRKSAGQAAVKKLATMLRTCDENHTSRNLLQYYGAATGRWAGRLWQPQNLKRLQEDALARFDSFIGGCSTPEEVLAACERLDVDFFSAVGDAMRSFMVAPPGMHLVSGDFSNIEGRGNAWLAGEQWKLDAFSAFDRGDGYDLYKLAYARAFQIDPKDVTKDQRQYGKVMELACIAEDTPVLTDRGLVPIQDVLLTDLVWDGVDFVPHDGVLLRGTKETLEYDGLRATPDHLVWVEGEDEPVAFGDAAARGQRLVRSAVGGSPVRLGGSRLRSETLPQRVDELLRGRTLHKLRSGALDSVCQSEARQVQRVPALFATEGSTSLVAETRSSDEGPLREPEERGVRPVRGPGVDLRLRGASGVRQMGRGQSGAAQGTGAGSYRQQPGLLAREPSVRNPVTEQSQPTAVPDNRDRRRVGANAKPFQRVSDLALLETGVSERGHHRAGVQSGDGQAQELAENPFAAGRARVYDILNAGPRNRFTAAGRLVHNCGYQGGVGAFQKMAVNLGVSVPDPVAQELVNGWREGHPAIKSSWRAYQDAAVEAVRSPGVPQWCVDGRIGYIFQHNVLYVRVPAGGFIAYPYAHIVWEDKFGSGKQSPVVKYKGVDSVTRQWVTKTLYGGLQCENVTQRVARDVMDQKIKAALKAGIDVRLHVHDELIAVDKDPGRAAELEAIMCEPLDWCPGFPIAAACWSDTRYIK